MFQADLFAGVPEQRYQVQAGLLRVGNGLEAVLMRTCVRSAGWNCHSLTKMVQPNRDPGLWREVGGLRM